MTSGIMTARTTAPNRESDLESLTSVLLNALRQKPAQTVTDLKSAVDHRFRRQVPLTYICVALCRLVNDGCVILKDGRCSALS